MMQNFSVQRQHYIFPKFCGILVTEYFLSKNLAVFIGEFFKKAIYSFFAVNQGLKPLCRSRLTNTAKKADKNPSDGFPCDPGIYIGLIFGRRNINPTFLRSTLYALRSTLVFKLHQTHAYIYTIS